MVVDTADKTDEHDAMKLSELLEGLTIRDQEEADYDYE